MSADRSSAWARRASEATGSRKVTAGSVGGGVLDDIDALLAEEDPAEVTTPAVTPPEGEDRPEPREPYL